jgi:hypothetical protein
MEIAIRAGFFAEWNVDVDTGHDAKVRYKELASGRYITKKRKNSISNDQIRGSICGG